MDLEHQDTVCKGEWFPGNRIVFWLSYLDGSGVAHGHHDSARKPLQKLEQSHSEPPGCEFPTLGSGRGMEDAPVDAGFPSVPLAGPSEVPRTCGW